MKRLSLTELTLTNFKNIDHFSINFNGNNADIVGDNSSGKTTIFDAFVWLLFGKDSKNNTKFNIKKLSENGNVAQHGLDHQVEGVFNLDGNAFSLKRVYKEVWVKKNGSATKKLKNHTTDYFIDGVPAKKKEYDEKVNSIIDDDTFLLLTNPLYFNEKMNWKKRREILVDICGDVTDDEVIAGDKNLSSFLHKLNGRNVEDHFKIVSAKKKEINQELDRLPIRIDEVNKSKVDLSDYSIDKIKNQIDILIDDKKENQNKINQIKNGEEINNKRKQLSDIELELSNIRNKYQQNSMQDIYSLKASIQEKESNNYLLLKDIELKENQLNSNTGQIKALERELVTLREKWIETNDKEFTHDNNCLCPTCNQQLPQEKIEEAKSKFNKNKSNQLEEIVVKGNKKKSEIEEIKATNQSIKAKIDDINKQINDNKHKIESLKAELNELNNSQNNIDTDIVYKNKIEEKEAVESDLMKLKEDQNSLINGYESKIIEIDYQLNNLNDRLNDFKHNEKINQRIAELEAKEEELSKEYEEIEYQLHMIDTFTRRKINALENKINNKFEYARFKLFEDQVNEGIKETCLTTFKGVPYNDLNNAMQINIGIDVLNTLQNYYGIQVPIFIDNAESVIRRMKTDAQMIGLVAKEIDEIDIKIKEALPSA